MMLMIKLMNSQILNTILSLDSTTFKILLLKQVQNAQFLGPGTAS